ncbi:DUF732 domain-containing protein [Streptomyces sp. PvR034]|uniref:DUF732 domain-containing protein n=1 Tax=Streptomyces sp. PvR034 TaxID=3156401 RepID=UPI0033980A3B
MNRRASCVLLCAVIAAAGLTACGSDQDGALPPARTGPAAAPAVTPSPPPEPDKGDKSADPRAKTPPPLPDAETEAKYLAALTAIDADIVHNKPDKAVEHGRSLCQTIARSPGDLKRQDDIAAVRFTSPAHPHGFGPTTAPRIRAAVHTHLCPTY